MGQSAAPKMRQLEVDIQDMAVIGADLACFAIASIVGGASNQQAAMTANNLLVREVQAYSRWKRSKVVLNPQLSQDYLLEMHQRVYHEIMQLAAVAALDTQKKEESKSWMSKLNLKRLVQSCWPWRV